MGSTAAVEAYRREAGFLHIAASPKPVEREVDIAERDAHQTQIERRKERGTRQPFGVRHASSRFASVSGCRERADKGGHHRDTVRGRTFRLDEILQRLVVTAKLSERLPSNQARIQKRG